jgi:hypothetical protein
MPDITRLEDHTGRPAEWPEGPVDWSKYAWNWQEAGLQKLLTGTGTAFVAAIVSNQARFIPCSRRSLCWSLIKERFATVC